MCQEQNAQRGLGVVLTCCLGSRLKKKNVEKWSATSVAYESQAWSSVQLGRELGDGFGCVDLFLLFC